MPKPWYLSKTLWLNVIIVLVAILGYLAYEPVIPAAWQQYLLAGMGVLNIILRFVTKGPVTIQTKQPPAAKQLG